MVGNKFKIIVLETNSKNKNITIIYTGISECLRVINLELTCYIMRMLVYLKIPATFG
jgi:hypothetical protein